MAISPPCLLALWARLFIKRTVNSGRKILAETAAPVRVLAGIATPFSSLDLEIGIRLLTVETIPWLTWFRSSIYSRALSKKDLMDLSRRFSCKVRLRVIIPSGPRLPVTYYPGVLSDATDDVLDWLIEKYL